MQIKEDKWKLLSARTEDTIVDQQKDTIVEFIKWLSYGILQIWGIIEFSILGIKQILHRFRNTQQFKFLA